MNFMEKAKAFISDDKKKKAKEKAKSMTVLDKLEKDKNVIKTARGLYNYTKNKKKSRDLLNHFLEEDGVFEIKGDKVLNFSAIRFNNLLPREPKKKDPDKK